MRIETRRVVMPSPTPGSIAGAVLVGRGLGALGAGSTLGGGRFSTGFGASTLGAGLALGAGAGRGAVEAIRGASTCCGFELGNAFQPSKASNAPTAPIPNDHRSQCRVFNVETDASSEGSPGR